MPASAPFQLRATERSISRIKAGSTTADFTPSDVARTTIAPAICCLIFATACLPASAISAMVFFSTSSTRARASRSMASAWAFASATIFAAWASASATSLPASERPFSSPSS